MAPLSGPAATRCSFASQASVIAPGPASTQPYLPWHIPCSITWECRTGVWTCRSDRKGAFPVVLDIPNFRVVFNCMASELGWHHLAFAPSSALLVSVDKLTSMMNFIVGD